MPCDLLVWNLPVVIFEVTPIMSGDRGHYDLAMSKDTSLSVPSDVVDLCRMLLGPQHKAGLLQPKYNHEHQLKILKQTAWNTLLLQHPGPHCFERPKTRDTTLSEVDWVYAHAYELRIHRRFDKASRLEHLVEQLIQCPESTDLMTAVLRLLLTLAGTADTDPSPALGHQHRLPIALIDSNLKNAVLLPEGPLEYGDTQLDTVNHHYMHFPRELFEQPGLIPDTKDKNLMHMIASKPGTNLQGTRIFQAKGSVGDDYEQTTYNSLYEALVQSRMTSIDLDFNLDLPDLADETNPPEVRIPKVYDTSDDEGFASSSFSSGYITPNDSGIGGARDCSDWKNGDIWQMALLHVPSRHRVWEKIGSIPGPTERPFLTEGGSEMLDHLWVVHMDHLLLIDPTMNLACRWKIQMEKLVTDVINLLLGVPSTSFTLNEATDELSICPGLYISGLTPEGLAEACCGPIECGVNYRCLTAFSQSVVMDSFYHGGLIFQAFTGAVSKYLQHYRACILSISEGKTLTEINFLLHRVYHQIRFLAELCHCVTPAGSEAEEESFPTGVHLLSYLYQHALEVAGSQHYSMMLSLLNTSAGPYLMFVQDWVFHGICRDIYGEFMIQVNEDFLRFRDKHYWKRGYVMLAADPETSVPLFLSDLANDMFVCGKSINMLKLCAPQHFLFTVEQEIPRVMITFSEDEIATTEMTCRGYLDHMQQIAKMKTLSRQQMLERAERAKQDLLIAARKAASEDLARLHAKADAQKEAEEARKRRLFAELKDQMEQHLLRQASDRKQEKEEGRAWIEEFNKQEVLEAKVNEELEKQAREELVDYYAKLSADAALREQRALWKVQRGRHDDARQAFLREEEAKLTAELQGIGVEQIDGKKITSNSVLSSKEPLILAQKAHSAEQLLVNQEVLPVWARADLKTAEPVFGLDTEALPSWAKKGLRQDGGEPVEVLELEFAQIGQESGTDTSVSEVIKQDADPVFKSSEVINLGDGDKVKSHVSDASVGDVLRSEPVPRLQVDGVRHLGVQQPDRGEHSHPSASSIQDLMYTEPQHKDDKNEAQSGASCKDPLNIVTKNIEQISEIDKSELRTKTVAESETVSMDESVKTDEVEIEAVDVNQQSLKLSKSEPMLRLTPKPKIRLMEGKHATTESMVEQVVRPSVRINQGAGALTESEPAGDKPSIRLVDERNVSEQSEEVEQKRHTKMSATMSATLQTDETAERPHLKTVENRHANVESEPTKEKSGVRLNTDRHASKESMQVVNKPKPRSMFGHISELSRAESNIQIPRMKRNLLSHPSMESNFKSYQIAPHRRRQVKAQSIDEISLEKQHRPCVRFDPAHHASVESTNQDVEEMRLSRFKERNIRGHASDSTVQKLLYGVKTGEETILPDFEQTDLALIISTALEPYDDQFNTLDSPPIVDLTATLGHVPFGALGDYGISTNPDVVAHDFISLPALLKRSIKAPLVAQISLVNQSIVNYYTTELDMDGHLGALRHFLLMEDGEFGQCLSELLFDKLAHSPEIHEVFNPMFLNNVLSSAVRSSMHADDKYASNFSFTLQYLPEVLRPNAPNVLDCLELTYKVPWPMNIIITENSLNKYSRISSFMLQLKRVVWVLKDVWHQLKRDALVNNASAGYQFRQLQLNRHEMQYLVMVLQGYLANQVIHVTWLELRQDLSNNVHNLDDLHNCHGNYLNKCLSRCLLNKKAEPVMKIIRDIFGLVLKFRMQLLSDNWQQDAATGQVTHPAFENMCATFYTFQNYSKFLFRVVRKLEVMGYEPHLQELLLRLNYNKYYSKDN